MLTSGAKFNKDRTRRRLLWRYWGSRVLPGKCACFVCLNPSTADEKTNDHSVTKMIGFSQRMECQGLYVVNLFDYCTTYPAELYGPAISFLNSRANDRAILEAAKSANVVICAWGSHGTLFDRDRAVLGMLRENQLTHKLKALAMNIDGTPAHPLRLSYSLRPFIYAWR